MVFRNPCPPEELFHVPSDSHQLNNLVEDPAHEEPLATARRLLKQWTEVTGDDVPKNLTPDRDARPGGKKPAEFRRGDFPGAARGATEINRRGPIKLESR